jgi:hypothetical protein
MRAEFTLSTRRALLEGFGGRFAIVPRAIRCGGAQPGAIDALQIEAGKEVWLVIKTYSCNLVEPSAR